MMLLYSRTLIKKPGSYMSALKIETLITALKSYISCDISVTNAKLTSFTDHINKTISNLNHPEDQHLESLQDNIYIPQEELLMKNEIIKSLTETQTLSQLHKDYILYVKNLRMQQKLKVILP